MYVSFRNKIVHDVDKISFIHFMKRSKNRPYNAEKRNYHQVDSTYISISIVDIIFTRIADFVGVIGEIELTDILQSHVGRHVFVQIIEHDHRNGHVLASSHRIRQIDGNEKRSEYSQL